ncbi:MAG: hypothetical protein ACREJX_05105, partial [Polyangiaceae bacterium]
VRGYFVLVFQKAQMLWLLLRHPPLLFLGQASPAINPINEGGIVHGLFSIASARFVRTPEKCKALFFWNNL